MPDTIDGAETLKKGSPSSYADCRPLLIIVGDGNTLTPAIAFASNVFPQPGGPCSKTPLGGCIPVCK